MRLVPLALVLIALVACGYKAPPLPPVEPPVSEALALHPEATAGVQHPALRQLLHEHWEHTLASAPLWATRLGDHRYDDRLGDPSAEATARDRAARDGFAARAAAIVTDPSLSAADRTTAELFLWDLQTAAGTDVCQFETWSFSPTSNPVSSFNYLPELHEVRTPEDGAKLLARYRAIPRYVDATIANLVRGLSAGRANNATTTRLTIEMVSRELDRPLSEWPLHAPVAAEHDWDPAALAAYRRDLRALIDGDVRAAYTRYRDFLRDDVLPSARPDDRVGMGALPDGEICYAATIRQHTSVALTADEVHATGLAELERIHAEMADLGERLFQTRDRAAIFERLRTDRSLYFASADEVAQKAEESLARAREAIPAWFGRLPETECVVRRIPDYEAPYTYVAYYRQPHPDGSKPGEYFVNTHAPETRPRYEAEVLAFHESIPGHHLQIAIAQELPDMPAFRRHMGTTGYVEGWALYTESLADEMGLYSGDLDRLGMLGFDSWRAARLVVDTGIHSQGWSREQAVRFMLDNTPLAANNITNEVDRYVGWPGQALGYKIGQLEMLALRRETEARLGERFDLRAWHDLVLGLGPVTLPVLREHVTAWQP